MMKNSSRRPKKAKNKLSTKLSVLRVLQSFTARLSDLLRVLQPDAAGIATPPSDSLIKKIKSFYSNMSLKQKLTHGRQTRQWRKVTTSDELVHAAEATRLLVYDFHVSQDACLNAAAAACCHLTERRNVPRSSRPETRPQQLQTPPPNLPTQPLHSAAPTFILI